MDAVKPRTSLMVCVSGTDWCADGYITLEQLDLVHDLAILEPDRDEHDQRALDDLISLIEAVQSRG